MRVLWWCEKSGLGFTLAATATVAKAKRTVFVSEPLGSIEHLSANTKQELLDWACKRLATRIGRLLS